jgi:riboflavin kinase/FMN adenylyltransferase
MQVHYDTEHLQWVNPVVTIGSFDGVHKGHVQVIASLQRVARQLQGETVIISFEPHPREVLYPLEKPPGILTTLEEKVKILERLGVDHLLILPFTRELAELEYDRFVRDILVEQIGVKGLVVGYDHRFGKNRAGTFESLKALSAYYHFFLEQEVAYEENQINISSTKIRNALQTGDIERVNDFLGYTYSIMGDVVTGDKIGRQLGFPTANLQLPDSRKLLPATGVYVVQVLIDGQQYGGMLNIGVRPTVLANGEPRIEVHIFDFSKEIYGAPIELKLLTRIRGEQYFPDIDSLAFQLKQDQVAARNYLSNL